MAFPGRMILQMAASRHCLAIVGPQFGEEWLDLSNEGKFWSGFRSACRLKESQAMVARELAVVGSFRACRSHA